VSGIRTIASVALLSAVLLVGCGGGGDTTVIQETTTTVVDSSTTTDASSATATTTASTTTDDSGGTGAAQSLNAFQSPSGNIACVMTAKLARCDIAERDWKPPPRPASCPLDYGQGIELRTTGTAQFVCAGDTALNAQAPTLDYGESSQVGAITCTSAESGMSCSNSSGGSFNLSREGYDLG
jgi:hypothetical protein